MFPSLFGKDIIVFELLLEASLFGEETNLLFKEFKSKSNKCFKGKSVLLILCEWLSLDDNFHKELTFWENEILQITNSMAVINLFMIGIT
jgi:hypothetical protein